MELKQPSEPKERISDFMLAEFETLRGLRADLIGLGENRVNVFLAVVSGGLVVLALLNQARDLGRVVPLLTGVILLGLLFLGLITFARTIERSIGIKIYTRGMNRIRRYFAQLDPNVKDFLLLPISDDHPSFKSMGWLPRGGMLLSLPGMVAVVNSIIASVGVSLSVTAIVGLGTVPVIMASFLAWLIVFSVQCIYMNTRLKKAEKSVEVRFPTGGTD